MSKYPSSPGESRTAKCYVCGEIISKVHMVNVGTDKEKEGYYHYRCIGCFCGSDNWLKFRKHLSPMGKYYDGLEQQRQLTRAMKEAAGGSKLDQTDSRNAREIAAKEKPTPAASPRRNDVPKKESRRPLATPEDLEGGLSARRKSWRTAKVRRSRR